MGGGGEDFAAQTAAAEAKKQKARDALNLQFGVAPTSGPPSTADYTTSVLGGGVGSGDTSPEGNGGGASGGYSSQFDQTGYDAALAAYNAQIPEAEKNKAAREALYTKVRGDAFTAGTRRLDETKQQAARDNNFALFAQGLNGGSEDVNQHALLDRTYNAGKLDLGAKADAAAAGLRGSDEDTRLSLLQSINSGLDQGSALSSSLNSMRVNSDKASAEAQGTDLGDLFANAGLLYSKSKAGQGVQDARSFWNTNYGGSRGGSNSSGARWGTTSATG